MRKGVLGNFAKLSGKHLCKILFSKRSPLQTLVIRWSYLRGGGLFAEFKSDSGNLAIIKKNFHD